MSDSAMSAAADRPREPFALVLGTAQDGGLPQAGCRNECCERARRDRRLRRRVASLLIADPRTGRRWLIDASPDLGEQLELAERHAPDPDRPRRRPVDAVFLTHAHFGHVVGLLQLGREVMGARGVPVFASERMRAFLRGNAPFCDLETHGHASLRPLSPARPVRLADDLELLPLAVPHRDEHSDTLAFVVATPRRRLLYLPDIDSWELWDRDLLEVLADVDVALIDGTFHDAAELDRPDLASVPHPPIADTRRRLADATPELRARVFFTHLNHSNPAARPDSAERQAIEAGGLGVAEDGQRFDL